jgi:hypothetical protein
VGRTAGDLASDEVLFAFLGRFFFLQFRCTRGKALLAADEAGGATANMWPASNDPAFRPFPCGGLLLYSFDHVF